MNFYKTLTVIFLASFLVSCGSSPEEKAKDLVLTINAENNTLKLGEKLLFSIDNPKNHEVTSVTYKFDGQDIKETSLTVEKLGIHTLQAEVYIDNKPITLNKNITVLNTQTPKIYKYNIINEYSHDINAYTQGLEFYKGTLYESTGQYGQSKLRTLDFKNGKVIKNVDLDRSYFGEGLTILNDKLYQLTWRSGTGFVYNPETLERISSFKYGKSKEGWGLCNNGKQLYKSDGTEAIWTLNPETLVEEEFIQVYTNKGKIGQLNELEWIDGKIYANIYQRNGVAIIDPKTGAVEGVIDFSPLKKLVTQHPKLDVLNGIAYNLETNTIFVTGKNWDKIFEVEVLE